MGRLAFMTVPGLVVFFLAGTAQGDFTLFSNRAGFDAATSGRTVIDFEGIDLAGNGFFVPVPPGITLSGVNFSASPQPVGQTGNLVVDGPGALFPGNSVLYNQSSFLDPDIIATLPGSFFAFGVDFGAETSGAATTEVTFTLSTGDTFTRTVTFGDLTFLGLTSTDPFTSVTMSIPPPSHDIAGLFIDNFTFGNQLAVVPEPSLPVALAGFGLMGLLGAASTLRRRRKASAVGSCC